MDNNLEIVNKHNAVPAAGTETYILAMNKFADLTNAALRALYLRPKGSHSSDTAAGIYAPGNGTVPDTMVQGLPATGRARFADNHLSDYFE